ncbi:MAG: hypothetical protein Q6363_005760 [Candidatus Njordarchaeota archaeon]
MAYVAWRVSEFAMSKWYWRIEDLCIPSFPIELSDEEIEYIRSSVLSEETEPIPESLFGKIRQCIVEHQLNLCYIRDDYRSPKDAYWMAWALPRSGPIFVSEKERDIYRLLRFFLQSERTEEDFMQKEPPRYLWLRPWMYITDEMRLFIRNKKLIAISQYDYYSIDAGRNLSHYFGLELSDILSDVMDYIAPIVEKIINIAKNVISRVPYDSFVLDIGKSRFYPGATFDKKVLTKIVQSAFRVIEINEFSRLTDPCLFSWDEIENLNDDSIVVKIKTERGVVSKILKM